MQAKSMAIALSTCFRKQERESTAHHRIRSAFGSISDDLLHRSGLAPRRHPVHEAPTPLLRIVTKMVQHEAADLCAARQPVDDGFDAFMRSVAARVIQHHWRKRTRPQQQGLPKHARGLVRLSVCQVTTLHALRMHMSACHAV